MEWRRVIAGALLAAMLLGSYIWGSLNERNAARRRPDYTPYNADQLSWVAEGIMERISELEDFLEYVRALQDEKLKQEGRVQHRERNAERTVYCP